MSGYPELNQDQSNAQTASACVGMKNPAVKLTQEKVREMFDYDPETGILTWRISRYPSKAGDVVESLDERGYNRVHINRKGYRAHRIIWLWYYGFFPENGIDHINRNCGDNRINNLREVSYQCNARNSKLPDNNRSGIRGVCIDRRRNKFLSSMMVNKKTCYFGMYNDLTEAVAHRLAAEQCLGWEGCDSCSSAFLHMQEYVKSKKAESKIPPS